MIDLKALRNVGNLHEFAVLFGFDWDDPDWDWTWHDVAVKMADDIEAWNTRKEPITIMSPITTVSEGEPQTYVPLRTCRMDVFAVHDDGTITYRCSECGRGYCVDDRPPNYCPDCGAKVVGK